MIAKHKMKLNCYLMVFKDGEGGYQFSFPAGLILKFCSTKIYILVIKFMRKVDRDRLQLSMQGAPVSS